MSAELFRVLAQIDLVDVPYNRGMATGAYADLMTGKVHMAFDNLPGSIELIRAGKLRPLAVTTTSRSPLLPNVPNMSEFVPGYEASAWYGIGVPKGTPTEIIDRLNKEVNAGLADAILRARLVDMGGMLLTDRPRQAHRGGNREMGKGDPDGQHQARMMPPGCCIRRILAPKSGSHHTG